MAENEQIQTTEQSSRFSPKLLIVILAIMFVEAGAVVGILHFTSPSNSQADIEARGLVQDEDQTTEVLVVSDRFQNHQSGRVWQWEIDVWLKVRQKDVPLVEARLERHKAEIRQEVNQIISRAQHGHLKEPEHQTLSRELTRAMEGFFSADSGDDPLFEALLLPKVQGVPADF